MNENSSFFFNPAAHCSLSSPILYCFFCLSLSLSLYGLPLPVRLPSTCYPPSVPPHSDERPHYGTGSNFVRQKQGQGQKRSYNVTGMRTSPKQKFVLCSRHQSKINQGCSTLQILTLLQKWKVLGQKEVELNASEVKRIKERVLSYPIFEVLIRLTDITSCCSEK